MDRERIGSTAAALRPRLPLLVALIALALAGVALAVTLGGDDERRLGIENVAAENGRGDGGPRGFGGRGGPGGPGGPAFGADVDPSELEAFRSCMEEQGVERPDRGERRDLTDEQREQLHAQREQALEACKGELPDEARQNLEAHQAFESCLEEQGVEKPSREERESLSDEQRQALHEQRRAAVLECADNLPEEAQQAIRQGEQFRSCLEENGARMLTPQQRRELSSEQREALRERQMQAFESCEDLAPEGGPRGFGGPGGHRGPGGPGFGRGGPGFGPGGPGLGPGPGGPSGSDSGQDGQQSPGALDGAGSDAAAA